MTVSEWLAARTPRPPDALRQRVLYRLGDSAAAYASEASAVCVAAAARTIAELNAADASTRDAAIDLLAADALITYAVEAASDAPDLPVRVEGMMRDLATIAGPA